MQLIDLPRQYQQLKQEIDKSIHTVLEHGQFILGPEVAKLEEQLADFIGVKHCISCANGTDALQLLFMAYGVGVGDAIFCPDVTFIASVEPAYMLGATPVMCDITKDTYNLCPQSLENQIEAVIVEGKYAPKVVVAVDFLGNSANYDAILKVCKKYHLILIEDAAQSFGALYHDKRCGSFGDSSTTSFFPAKPLGCYGDGGAIFTDDDFIAEVCRSICVHGKGPNGKYDNIRIGLNSRLDTIQAAVLIAKLAALKQYELAQRQFIAKRYNEAFADAFVTPYVGEKCESVYAQYALLAKTREQRDRILASLSKKGIPNMVYYPTPQHMLPVFKDIPTYNESFQNSIHYCAHTFSLPMHPYLTEEEQVTVIDAVLLIKQDL